MGGLICDIMTTMLNRRFIVSYCILSYRIVNMYCFVLYCSVLRNCIALYCIDEMLSGTKGVCILTRNKDLYDTPIMLSGTLLMCDVTSTNYILVHTYIVHTPKQMYTFNMAEPRPRMQPGSAIFSATIMQNQGKRE